MESIPIINSDNKNLLGNIALAMKVVQGSTAYQNNRGRPYNGQSHTVNGKRGETEIHGLTMRDVSDCIAQGFLAASGKKELQDKTKEISNDFKNTEYASKNTWIHDDIYKLDCDFDPGAVIKNTMCFVEDMMDIYPNINPLEVEKSTQKLLNYDNEENI